MRLMVSSIRVPPRSSHAAARAACAAPSAPSFTHEHWTWSIAPCSISAGHRVHGPVVARGRARAGRRRRGRPARCGGRTAAATNSVKPPVRSWIRRSSAQVRDPVRRGVDVAVHHRRARPDAQLVRRGDDLDPRGGRQLALGQHPADVVVEDLRRGARDRVQAGGLAPRRATRARTWPARVAPLTTSIGENACRWMSGARRFTARARSKYAVPGRSGWMPPCMQTSVAPTSHASPTRSPPRSSESVNASASVRRCANAQNRQPV